MVQRNAATAEESASASEEMNAQAETMKGYVGELAVLIEGRNGKGKGEQTGLFKKFSKGDGNGKRPDVSPPATRSKEPIPGNRLDKGKKGLPAALSPKSSPRLSKVNPERVFPLEEEQFKSF